MSRSIPAAITTALTADSLKPFFAVNMNFDSGDLNLWTGLGDLVIDGVTYTGGGNLLRITKVEETAEIEARGAIIRLSGIPSSVLSLALSEPYQGRTATIYFGVLGSEYSVGANEPNLVASFSDEVYYSSDEDGYVSSSVSGSPSDLMEVFTGYMDTMNIEESPSGCTVELAIESKLIDLERTRVARYTSSYQKSIYPNDKGFDFVEDLQEKKVYWGRKAGA